MKTLTISKRKPAGSEATHETGAYHGNPEEEVLQRMRRLETRVSNLLRCVGMLPSCNPPDPLKGRAVYDEGVVYVTSPDVSLAEVSAAAVRGADGRSRTVLIVLNNQPWGELVVRGKP